MSVPLATAPLSTARIFRTWWPLAASWLLMGAELPALAAVVARLPNPEINLAAYGGIVFPIALIIESPIIMLLAASTALSKDWPSYRKLYHFMMVAGAALTALHILIAFTPLYYFVAVRILGAPLVIVEPGRIGLMLMTPWTWSIAYRRFNQGVLIRFGHSKAVGVGTLIRLSADLTVLFAGYMIGTIPGIVVATCAVSAGVISEAIYAGIAVRPVLRRQVRPAPLAEPRLTLRSFLDFYIPLAMMQLLFLLVQPIGSAAMGRMPLTIPSLAVWPVLSGLTFMLRSLGVAYNEVVVALLDEPLSWQSLRRFTLLLLVSTTALQLLITATPFSRIWFEQISGLSPGLVSLAIVGLWLALPLPGLNVLQSWFQGIILHGRRTRGITESVAIFLVTCTAILWAGVTRTQATGLYVAMAAFVVANVAQTTWLWVRSRSAERQVVERDTQPAFLEPSEAPAD